MHGLRRGTETVLVKFSYPAGLGKGSSNSVSVFAETNVKPMRLLNEDAGHEGSKVNLLLPATELRYRAPDAIEPRLRSMEEMYLPD
jgi:hypothetical protein